MTKRKLIEVSLPLEQINKQAAREKSIRHGHPSTLHLWWARRPLAAARAVLFSQLVDDPSAHEDDYRAEGIEQGLTAEELDAYIEQRVTAERKRLHNLLAAIVDWDNLGDEGLFNQAREEIRRSCDGDPPPILDPFAGGGSIPLEAQRLGLEAHASDLNPVAVLINKALIEIPPKVAGRAPVHPDVEEQIGGWPRATGLAEDVRRYGQWIRDEAERRIGHLYPKATLEDGTEANVIAWIWARTVTCPNPACGIEMPLVRSWWLGKKKGKEAYVVPRVEGGRVTYSIGHDPKSAPTKDSDGTVDRSGATCIGCGSAVPLKYVREQGRNRGLGEQLMAVVAEGRRRREYRPPTPEHVDAAIVPMPVDVPGGALPNNPRDFKTPNYGMSEWADLFTPRQLTALTTFSDLVGEARERVLSDALAAGMPAGESLESGGTCAHAYADAVATFLGLTLSKAIARNNVMCGWESGMDRLRGSFQRQAVPMSWDFAEAHPLTSTGGGFLAVLESEVEVVDRLPAAGMAVVRQGDARTSDWVGALSTDPPYYDNVGYSDLSDFFYVWLRLSLRSVFPSVFATSSVPKAEELVANPYRHGGRLGAHDYFESGFRDFFRSARSGLGFDIPATVYYAFKQSESSDSGQASTGWQTLLQGMVENGWEITATWPMRSEMASRMIASGTNALASSIVLAIRPRAANAPSIDRREFVEILREELPDKLRELQQGAIAPVDLPQAAIGPGMSVYSRYTTVMEPNGEQVTVRAALQLINSVLAEVLTSQESDFDAETRWCIKWFETHGFGRAPYGDAENLASAYNTSVAGLGRTGVVHARGGEVRLLDAPDLSDGYRPDRDDRISLWEVTNHMAAALAASGLDETGRILARATGRAQGAIDAELVKELAYLVFSIAEQRGMTEPATRFNALVTSWPEVVAAAKSARGRDTTGIQTGLDFDDDLS